MKRILHLFTAAVLCVLVMNTYSAKTGAEQLSAPESTLEDTESLPRDGAFAYTHDPRDCPDAMADIIENDEAVYGFSPDPESGRLGPYAEI